MHNQTHHTFAEGRGRHLHRALPVSMARSLVTGPNCCARFFKGGRIDSNWAELAGLGVSGLVPAGSAVYEMCLNGNLGMRCNNGGGSTYWATAGDIENVTTRTFTGDPAFSIALWFELGDAGDGGLCGWGNALTALEAAGLIITSSALSLAFAGGNNATCPGTFIVGSHYFVCATKAPGAITANTTFYVDGKNAGAPSGSSNTPAVTDSTFCVGRWGSLDGFGVSSRVSQCVLWDRVLSAGEVYSLHQMNRHL